MSREFGRGLFLKRATATLLVPPILGRVGAAVDPAYSDPTQQTVYLGKRGAEGGIIVATLSTMGSGRQVSRRALWGEFAGLALAGGALTAEQSSCGSSSTTGIPTPNIAGTATATSKQLQSDLDATREANFGTPATEYQEGKYDSAFSVLRASLYVANASGPNQQEQGTLWLADEDADYLYLGGAGHFMDGFAAAGSPLTLQLQRPFDTKEKNWVNVTKFGKMRSGKYDFAMFKVPKSFFPANDFPNPLPYADDQVFRVGETVIASGFPYEFVGGNPDKALANDIVVTVDTVTGANVWESHQKNVFIDQGMSGAPAARVNGTNVVVAGSVEIRSDVTKEYGVGGDPIDAAELISSLRKMPV